MIRVKQSSTVLLLLFNLIACSQRPQAPSAATPTFTPFVAGTETGLAFQAASPTPWFAGTETALANLTPTAWVAGTETAMAVASTSPTPLAPPTFPPVLSATPDLSFSPVFHAFQGYPSLILVGGVMQQRGWLSAEDAAAYVSPDVNYDLYSPLTTAHVAGRALQFSPTCRQHFLGSSAQMPDAMVGVASHWIVEGAAPKIFPQTTLPMFRLLASGSNPRGIPRRRFGSPGSSRRISRVMGSTKSS